MKCEAWCFSVLHSCSWYPWRMCSCLWKEKGTKKNRRERNGTERKGREMNIREGKIRKQNRREENIREENRGQNKKKRCDCNGTRGAGWMWRGRKARANYFRVSFISFLLVFPCSKQHFQAEGSNLKTENIMLKYVKNCPPFLLRIRRDWQCLILIRTRNVHHEHYRIWIEPLQDIKAVLSAATLWSLKKSRICLDARRYLQFEKVWHRKTFGCSKSPLREPQMSHCDVSVSAERKLTTSIVIISILNTVYRLFALTFYFFLT